MLSSCDWDKSTILLPILTMLTLIVFGNKSHLIGTRLKSIRIMINFDT